MIIKSKQIDNKNTQILQIVKLEDTFFLVYKGDKIKYSHSDLSLVEYEFNNFNA
jgi:hypothetical protein